MDTVRALHPTADELSLYALDNEGAGVEEHLRNCPACARFVKEMRLARAAVAGTPEADVPAELERRILAHREVPRKAIALPNRWTEWYRNPFVIGLGLVLTIIFFYIFFVFVLD